MKTNYFLDSSGWSLLNFLKFQNEETWTADKCKEYNTYVKTLRKKAETSSSNQQQMAKLTLDNYEEEINSKEVKEFWKDVNMKQNAEEQKTVLENLDMAFTMERTLEHNEYINEVGQQRKNLLKKGTEEQEEEKELSTKKSEKRKPSYSGDNLAETEVSRS
ncbi:hypothetical protein Glove_8g16 [Diversispora epigaea]|uniref:Uncharacterized protein n=1 Tax=Diversispora epigaea TaxID=1348612 RepID=A0A397JRQ9_9GLOM|nr:hypothetical protein Glove_8g16 [Diversispora epigaea]